MLFDTHAHYVDKQFENDLHPLLESLQAKGVGYIITCSCTIEQAHESKRLSEKYPFVYYSAGIHPLDCGDYEQNTVNELIGFAEDKKCVAIGEIGLDYHYRSDRKELQRLWFEQQIKLAKELNMPVIVHDREAHADCYKILEKYRPKGVMHCFSGSSELAIEYIKMGMYISFAGVLTFANAKKAIEAAKVVPMDKLLIETDCPYLSPHPMRGKRNDSSNLIYTCVKLSEIKGISYDEAKQQTCENAKTLFNIK